VLYLRLFCPGCNPDPDFDLDDNSFLSLPTENQYAIALVLGGDALDKRRLTQCNRP
jgi:hypothetical protein